MQAIVFNVHKSGTRHLAPLRRACRKLRDQCDALVVTHTLTLSRADATWQLPILRRFKNLCELRADLRKGCTEPRELYALLADVVRTVPELHTLHVVCGLSDSDARLELPHTGSSDLCESLLTLNRLQHLHFNGHGPAASGSDVLRAAVQHAPSLHHLVVNFAISNAGVAHLAPSLRENAALSSLHLSAAAVGDAGAAALALSLAHNHALVELDLSRVRSPTDILHCGTSDAPQSSAIAGIRM